MHAADFFFVPNDSSAILAMRMDNVARAMPVDMLTDARDTGKQDRPFGLAQPY